MGGHAISCGEEVVITGRGSGVNRFLLVPGPQRKWEHRGADASLWEIAIEVSVGKLNTVPSSATVVSELGFERSTMATRQVEVPATLPLRHRDPFDRMLIAQAPTDDLTVITADPIFANYGVRVVNASA